MTLNQYWEAQALIDAWHEEFEHMSWELAEDSLPLDTRTVDFLLSLEKPVE